MAFQILRTQARHHVDVLNALVGVLGIQVERLPVEDHRGCVLVLVCPAADLNHGLQVGDDQLGMLIGHHIGTGDHGGAVSHLQGPVRVPGQVKDGLELTGGLRELLQGPALVVDGINLAFQECLLQRAEGKVVLVVAAHPQLGRVVHRHLKHFGLVVPVVRVGKFDELDIVHGHVIHHEHQLNTGVLLDAPPVSLDGVETLGEADFLALQILHAVYGVTGTHHHHAALVDLRSTQQHGAAHVCMDVDRRVETTEADQVVEVVDVVRVPVVLGCVAEVGILDANLLELLTAPPQFLVNVVCGYHGAIGEPHLFPVQRYRGGLLFLLCHNYLFLLQIPSLRGKVISNFRSQICITQGMLAPF